MREAGPMGLPLLVLGDVGAVDAAHCRHMISLIDKD
jgi:hypothetical protein